MLRFDKGLYLSLLFNFNLSERFSESLWGSDVLLFPELINIISILLYTFIEFIILLYIFSVIYFTHYKGYMTWRNSFSKFLHVLPAFTCARATRNLWSICLRVNILIYFLCDAFNGNILLLNTLRLKSGPS